VPAFTSNGKMTSAYEYFKFTCHLSVAARNSESVGYYIDRARNEKLGDSGTGSCFFVFLGDSDD
jgi:hypothetical protein